MKKKLVSFETVLNRQLQNPAVRIEFEHRRFHLQVARLIAKLREESSLTQSQLAKAAKVSQPLIARLERGDQNRNPTFETLSKVLNALGYSIQLNLVPLKKAA